jgi:hypothetical protein
MAKTDIRNFEGQLQAFEVIDVGKYIMTTARRQEYVFPEGVTVYDLGEGVLYYGDGSTQGGLQIGSGGGGVPEAPVDGKQYGREDAGWTEVTGGLKTFNFEFSRTLLSGYGGGDVDLPYVDILEGDVTQVLPEYYGVAGSAATTITGVQFQNGQVAPAGGIEVYIKNDGVRSVVGTVTAGERLGVFQTSIPVVQDTFVIFGFNAQSGSYPAPTVTAYIETAGL